MWSNYVSNDYLTSKNGLRIYLVFLSITILFSFTIMGNPGKEIPDLGNSFRRSYANNRLDSRILENVSAKGNIGSIYDFTVPPRTEEVSNLFLSSTTAVLSCEKTVILYDLKNRKEVGNRPVGKLSLIILNDQKGLFYATTCLYYAKDCVLPGRGDYYDIPVNPGNYSTLTDLFVFEKMFISIVHLSNTPKLHRDKIILSANPYSKAAKYLWAHEFSGKNPPAPISNSGVIIVCENSKVHAINSNNETLIRSEELDGVPQWCSSNDQNNFYFILKTSSGPLLLCTSQMFEIHWQQSMDLSGFSQPAIISNTGTAFILGSRHLQSYTDDGLQWNFTRIGSEKSAFKATLTNNNKLLIIDGNRLLCMDEHGNTEWVVKHPGDGEFQTQPFCNKLGNVWIADSRSIFCIE